jgi:hypothetical protein
LALPTTAPAAGGFDLEFQVGASHGYTLTVGGYDATATITAAKSDPAQGRKAWSTYVVRGKVNPTSMHASFGALGHVDTRFRPSGPTRYGRRHDHCIGPHRYTIRPGAFVGSLRFRGEGGYTSANVHRVIGQIVTPRRLICRDIFIKEIEREDEGDSGKKRGKVTQLSAFMRSGLTAMLFGAAEWDGKARFFAGVEQTVGSLGVFRGVFVRASHATFAAGNALSFAGVTPPAPFSGSGSFQRGPNGAKSWTGSLAVSFPGAPNVSLTDPRFKTQLTRSW